MQLQKVFNYNNATVRTVIIDGNPWFVAKDVCEILEISKYRDAVSRLDDDERGSVLVDTLGGPQEMTAVNEAGLYSLIMVSRKPEAKQFKRWVTHEVLPSIRKTGSYDGKFDSIINSNLNVKEKRRLINEAINQYKQIQIEKLTIAELNKPDHILEFLDECCEFDDDAVIEQTELYRVYVCWCIDNNHEPYGKIVFTRKIESFSDAVYLPADHKQFLNRRFLGVTVNE